MQEWLDNPLQATDWCCECIKKMILYHQPNLHIPDAPDYVLHEVSCGAKLVVEDGAPVSKLAWTGRSCAQHFSHSA